MADDQPPIGFSLPAHCQLRPTAVGIRAPIHQAHAQARRQLPEFICFLVTKGCIHLLDEGDGHEESYAVPRGYLHIVAPHMWQRALVDFPIGISFIWWHFVLDQDYSSVSAEKASLLMQEQARSGLQKQIVIPRHLNVQAQLREFLHLHEQLQSSCRRWTTADAGAVSLCTWMGHRLHQLFGAFMLEHHQQESGSSDSRHSLRAQAVIREELEKMGSLAQVAEALHLDSAYLARCFKRATGRTVGDEIIQARLDKACTLMQDPELGLKEIAAQCGFGSLGYFSRRFKQVIGKTPSAYRRGFTA